METLSPVLLGINISVGFLFLLLIRQFSLKRFVDRAEPFQRAKRAFLLELIICISAAILIIAYQNLVFQFPLSSGGSLLIGCFIAGFFIGLDASIIKERQAIEQAVILRKYEDNSKRIFPITRKFALIAITTFIFIFLILVMVFTRDIVWLVNTAQNPASIMDAQLSVTYEILFVMAILMIFVVNLIVSYSKNLKLLFDNETLILEKVRNGDLSSKVPVATQDEFGVIAAHTNHMIDGLRHRFELIHSLKLAEEVQQNLLPTKSPFLKGFDVSGASEYCDQTGGDYYDFFLLPDDKLGIVVADACGHGVGAAMLMTSFRAFLISAFENYSEPAQLVDHVNKLTCRDCAASGTFTTLFFLELDQHSSTIRWIRAGHEPPLFFHSNTKQISKLGGGGIVLGIDESYVFETQESDQLQTGDIILIGTDGIFETRNKDQVPFGQEKVQKVLFDYAHASAIDIRNALMDEIKNFRGNTNLEDDITLVVVKKR